MNQQLKVVLMYHMHTTGHSEFVLGWGPDQQLTLGLVAWKGREACGASWEGPVCVPQAAPRVCSEPPREVLPSPAPLLVPKSWPQFYTKDGKTITGKSSQSAGHPMNSTRARKDTAALKTCRGLGCAGQGGDQRMLLPGQVGSELVQILEDPAMCQKLPA